MLLLFTGIYAFVILKDGVVDNEDDVIANLQQLIRKHIGGFAVPQHFLVSTCTYMYCVNKAFTYDEPLLQ